MAQGQRSHASAYEMLARAWRDVSLARAAEAFFLGLTAMLVAVSAALHAGAELGDIEAWLAGLLTAFFAGASWWFERKPDIARLAQKVDAKLRLDGSLVTAFECESGDENSGVARLLAERIRQSVRVSDVVRAALPNSIPFLAPPFAAAALLAATLNEPPTDKTWIRPRTLALMTEMESVRESVLDGIEAGALDADLLQQALALENQARDLARKSSREGAEPADWREDMENLDQSLADLALQMPPRSPALEAIRDAEALTDGALSGLDRSEDKEAETSSGSGNIARDGPDSGADGSASEVAGEDVLGEKGTGSLANGAADGRISAPLTPADANPAGAAARGVPDRTHGVAAGRWWPESYAGVVERWAEARRTARKETSERD